jgi:hypothetical protein
MHKSSIKNGKPRNLYERCRIVDYGTLNGFYFLFRTSLKKTGRTAPHVRPGLNFPVCFSHYKTQRQEIVEHVVPRVPISHIDMQT